MKILKQQFKIFKDERRKTQKPQKNDIKIEKTTKNTKNNKIGNQTGKKLECLQAKTGNHEPLKFLKWTIVKQHGEEKRQEG